MHLIDLDELKKFPIRRDNYDKEHGDENYILGIEAVLEYASELPNYAWISCKDSLPDKSGVYLIYHENEEMFQCYFDSGIDADEESPFGYWEQHFDSDTLGWCGEDWVPCEGVTHWMQLPSLPDTNDDEQYEGGKENV